MMRRFRRRRGGLRSVGLVIAAASTLVSGGAAAAVLRAAPSSRSWLDLVLHVFAAHGLALIIASGLTYLCCYPVFTFCYRGWSIKKRDILSSFGLEARRLYLNTFIVTDEAAMITTREQAKLEFEEMYRHRYGRYRLVIPTTLLVLVVATLALGVAESSLAAALGGAASKELVVLPLAATAAIAGAYAWVVYDLIKSSARYDLPPSTLLGAALRLVIAVPLGDAVTGLVSDPLGPFLAFAMGAFPLAALELVLKRLVTDRLKVDLLPGAEPDQVKVIDGVDSLTADRLALAGVSTIGELAYVDPVQLSMRTNIAFDTVLNFVNQALAFLYLGSRMNDLRVMGLRGAVEIRHLQAKVAAGDADAKAAFTTAVGAANASVDPKAGFRIEAAGLRRAFHEIGDDPRAKFLAEIWRANANRGAGLEPLARVDVVPRRARRHRPAFKKAWT